MKEQIIDIKDFTDSKEFIESKVPNFFIFFIYLISSFLLILLIWMWFSKIDIVVKGTGLIRPSKNISTVINIHSGELESIEYYEGKEVKRGDILYSVNTNILELQKTLFKNTLEKLEDEVKNLKILLKSVEEEKNHFNGSGNKFFHRYQYYASTQNQLNLEYNQIKERYNQSKVLGDRFVSANSLREYINNMESIKGRIDGNKSQMLFDINQELHPKEEEILKLQNEISNFEKIIRESRVEAPIDGVVQVVTHYNKGDFIGANAEILRIIPEGTELKMEMFIENKDIGKVKQNSEVKYRILAFPHEEYGVIQGYVTTISRDAINNGENGGMVYRVEGSILETTVYNREGKEGQLKIGMLSEVRVVSGRKRILYIALEKLDFMKKI